MFTDLPTTRDQTPSLTAHLLLLTRLYRYAEQELGQRQAARLIAAAFADTALSQAGFDKNGFTSDDQTKTILAAIPNNQLKLQSYKTALQTLVNDLAGVLPRATVADVCRKAEQEIQKQTKVSPQTLSFAAALVPAPKTAWQKLLAKVPFPKTQASIVPQATVSCDLPALRGLLSYISEAVLLVDETHKIVFANKTSADVLDLATSEIEGHYLAQVLHLANETSTISDMIYLPNLYDGNKSIFYFGKNLKLTSATSRVSFVDLHVEHTVLAHNKPHFAIIMKPVNASYSFDKNQHDLFSITAHELRSPLTSLRGYLAILQDELRDTVTADQLTILNRIATSTNELMAIIENILAFTKIENQNFHLEFEEVDYADLIEKTIAQIAPVAQAKHLTITFEKPAKPLPHFAVDKLRIMEVINNLLTNAIKFTPAGGRIWIRVAHTGTTLQTEVSDTGVGIDDVILPKLFTKYVQANPTQQNNSSGAGLGLYIAKEIVKGHNGEISVHSAVGKGSTFTFTLPLTLQPTLGTDQKHHFTSGGTPLQLTN